MMHIDLNLYLVLSNLIPSTILFVAPYPSAVLSQIKKLFLFKKTSSQASNMLWQGGMIIGQKSMENDIGRQYVSNYCPKSKKLIPLPPKPLNIDIGQSFPTSGSIESLKKNRATLTLLFSIFANIFLPHPRPSPTLTIFRTGTYFIKNQNYTKSNIFVVQVVPMGEACIFIG